MILGDRHARGCANKIKYKLNKNFNVIHFTKQEPDIPTLTVSAKGAIEKLTKNDALVFFGGGTKDVGKNNTIEGIKHVIYFAKE